MLARHGRYDYHPWRGRTPYAWPGGAKLAVYIGLNLEHFAFGEGLGAELAPGGPQPDVMNYAWRDYGNRVGAWRLLDLFDELQLPATVLLNSAMYDYAPALLAAHRARGDEFAGHGRSNSERQSILPEAEEAALITESSAAIARVGPAARADVHRWRRLFPAIAVTADTLLADNPRLTARDAEGEHAPVRFVLDRRFRSAGRAGLNLFTDAFRGRTVVVGLAAGARAADLAWYEAEGVKVWALPGEEVDFLDAWAERCATEGLNGVLIEAGPRFASALLREGAADYLFAYVAPRLGGDPESPTWFEGVDFPLMAGKTSLFGQDALFRGYLG